MSGPARAGITPCSSNHETNHRQAIQRPIIDGYIKHHDYPGHLPLEAAFWLFLAFEPRLFWQMFGHIGAHKANLLTTPICWLSSQVFWGVRFPGTLWSKFQNWKYRFKDRLVTLHGISAPDDDLPF
jgi:hypothetical protein